MATYESLKEETKTFGKNGYIEVARKRLQENGSTTDFVLVTRGYFDKDGTKKWTRFVTLPDDPEVKDWLRASLAKV